MGHRVPVSLATVYNTLHQFTEAGLLREVAVDGSKTYFDTNTDDHHHFFIEGENRIVDIPMLGPARRGPARRRWQAWKSPASTSSSACAASKADPADRDARRQMGFRAEMTSACSGIRIGAVPKSVS